MEISKQSMESTMSNEAICSSFLAWTKATTCWCSQLGYLGFLIDLTSFPMSLDPCVFILPFFLLFFEFAHGWIKLSFRTSRMFVCIDYNCHALRTLLQLLAFALCLHAHWVSNIKGMMDGIVLLIWHVKQGIIVTVCTSSPTSTCFCHYKILYQPL
jgi:hypothetical protein